MAQPMLELRLLGQFDVRLGEVPIGIPSRPAQSLLAYLALTAGTAHRRERLAALLWPDVEDDSARASLRQGLWRIRKALEARLPSGVQYLLADDLTVAFNAKSTYRPTCVDPGRRVSRPGTGILRTSRGRTGRADWVGIH